MGEFNKINKRKKNKRRTEAKIIRKEIEIKRKGKKKIERIAIEKERIIIKREKEARIII